MRRINFSNLSTVTILSVMLLASVLTSCASNPKEIPATKTLEELKLTAYEYSAKENYNAAIRYYNEVIARFGTDTAVLIAARFEIAHIYVKQKKFKEAEPMLNEILAYYDSASFYLPSQYKTLAQIDLQKISDHKNKVNKKKSK